MFWKIDRISEKQSEGKAQCTEMRVNLESESPEVEREKHITVRKRSDNCLIIGFGSHSWHPLS
jgi:hypothetical protein